MMTRNVECVGPEVSLQEAAARMKSLDVGSMPVCENDRLVGMITDRDITIRATAEGEDPKVVHVRDVMTPDIVYFFDDQLASEALGQMKEDQIRRLVVLNRDKQLVGIVSLGDVAVEAGDDELVGDALEGVSEPSRPARW